MLEEFLRYLLALTYKHLENITHILGVINRIVRSLRIFVTVAHHPRNFGEKHIAHNLIYNLRRDTVSLVYASSDFSDWLAVLRAMIPDISLDSFFELILYGD